MNIIDSNRDSISKISNELNKPKISVVLIHHVQCGHCINLKPTWERFKELNKNKPFKIIDIEANELSKLDHPIKNTINGFPTIMKVKNGKVDENFVEERTLDNINAFANNNVKKKLNNLNSKINKENNKTKKKQPNKKGKTGKNKMVKNKMVKNKTGKKVKKGKGKK